MIFILFDCVNTHFIPEIGITNWVLEIDNCIAVQQRISTAYAEFLNNTPTIITEGMYNISIIEILEYINTSQIKEQTIYFPFINIAFFILFVFCSYYYYQKQINIPLIITNILLLLIKTELLIYVFYSEIFINLNLFVIVYGLLVYFKHLTGYTTFVRNYREKNSVKILALNFPIKKAQQLFWEKVELISKIKKGLQQQTISINSLLLIVGLSIILICMYKIIKILIWQQLGIFLLLGAFLHYFLENFDYPIISTMRKVGKIIEEGVKKRGLNIASVFPEVPPKMPTNKEDHNIKIQQNKQENLNQALKFNISESNDKNEINIPKDYKIKQEKQYQILSRCQLMDYETRAKLNHLVPKKLNYVNPYTEEVTQHSRTYFFKKTTEVLTGEIINFNPRNTPHIDYFLNLPTPLDKYKYLTKHIFEIRQEFRIGEMNKYEFDALNISEEEIQEIKDNSKQTNLKFNRIVLNELIPVEEYKINQVDQQVRIYTDEEIQKGKGKNRVSQFLHELFVPHAIALQTVKKDSSDFLGTNTNYISGEADGYLFSIEIEENGDKSVILHEVQAKFSQSMRVMRSHIKDFFIDPIYKKTSIFIGAIYDGYIFIEKDLETNELIRAEFIPITTATRIKTDKFFLNFDALRVAMEARNIIKREVLDEYQQSSQYSLNTTKGRAIRLNRIQNAFNQTNLTLNKTNDVD